MFEYFKQSCDYATEEADLTFDNFKTTFEKDAEKGNLQNKYSGGEVSYMFLRHINDIYQTRHLCGEYQRRISDKLEELTSDYEVKKILQENFFCMFEIQKRLSVVLPSDKPIYSDFFLQNY